LPRRSRPTAGRRGVLLPDGQTTPFARRVAVEYQRGPADTDRTCGPRSRSKCWGWRMIGRGGGCGRRRTSADQMGEEQRDKQGQREEAHCTESQARSFPLSEDAYNFDKGLPPVHVRCSATPN
jgi:hypothetical protein